VCGLNPTVIQKKRKWGASRIKQPGNDRRGKKKLEQTWPKQNVGIIGVPVSMATLMKPNLFFKYNTCQYPSLHEHVEQYPTFLFHTGTNEKENLSEQKLPHGPSLSSDTPAHLLA
jgi:hypothetical protein